jgi:hypothetical protein
MNNAASPFLPICANKTAITTTKERAETGAVCEQPTHAEMHLRRSWNLFLCSCKAKETYTIPDNEHRKRRRRKQKRKRHAQAHSQRSGKARGKGGEAVTSVLECAHQLVFNAFLTFASGSGSLALNAVLCMLYR